MSLTKPQLEFMTALLQGQQRIPRDHQEDDCRHLCRRNFVWWTRGRWRVTGRGAAFAVLHGYRGTLENVRSMPDDMLRKLHTKGNKSAEKRAGDL